MVRGRLDIGGFVLFNHTLIGIHLLMVTKACSTLTSETLLILSMVLSFGRPGESILKDRNRFL